MQTFIFATLAVDKKEVDGALLLAQSLRTFGASHANSPFWLFVPQSLMPALEMSFPSNIQVFPIEMKTAYLDFPFAPKTLAAGIAEEQVIGQCQQLVWLDPNVIIAQEPTALLLPEAKVLACRPVDHRLIGAHFDHPLSPFWQLIFDKFDIDPTSIAPLNTSLEQEAIYPYFNAGLLVVRPEAGLLQSWSAAFRDIFQSSNVRPFYQKNQLYQLFIHQAVLAGVILSNVSQSAIQQLPLIANYPLHLHSKLPPGRRINRLNQATLFRYEEFFTDSNWATRIKVDEPLSTWLGEHLPQ